jgi:hypothetical protein
MKKITSMFFIKGMAIITLCLFVISCEKDNGGRLPLPPMNLTIDPNSTIYQEINVVGGWMYLGVEDGADYPSRGVIVYRLSTDQFMAYERTPPFKPDSCCNVNKTVCTSLLVDNYFPFVMDTCTGSKYLILDGSVVSGPSNMSLSMYVTEYYGDLLYIHD